MKRFGAKPSSLFPEKDNDRNTVLVCSCRWYEFVTSVCGIIGGTYQVMGLIDSALYRVTKGGKGL